MGAGFQAACQSGLWPLGCLSKPQNMTLHPELLKQSVYVCVCVCVCVKERHCRLTDPHTMSNPPSSENISFSGCPDSQ